MKTCSKCGKEKTLAEFGLSKNRPDGHDIYCFECRRLIRKKYRERNAQQIREAQAEYRVKHAEDKREYDRKYREANREKIQQRRRDYYSANKDAEQARAKGWKDEHPEQFRAVHTAAKHRYRTQLRENGGGYTLDQLRECLDFFGYRCAYTGEPLTPDYHIDHVVPVSKGGTNNINNIVPANPTPNIQKRDRDWVEWFKSSPYFSEERYRKIIEWLNQ